MLYVTFVWFYTIFVFHHGPWVEVFQTICWIRISLLRDRTSRQVVPRQQLRIQKEKKQIFACFDLIRCVLSLSLKREIPIRSEVWLILFTCFSSHYFWCSFGLYLNKKIPPQHSPPFLQFNPKVLFVSRVSARPLRLSEKLFEKGTNNCQ